MVELWIAIAAVAGIILGTFIGFLIRKLIAEKTIKSAEIEAQRIVEEAKKGAETVKKEAAIEARDEAHKIKSEAEREAKERRKEITRIENRLTQKEEHLDKRIDNLDKKEEQLNAKIKENSDLTAEIESVKAEQAELLQKISGMTIEEARQLLLDRAESEARHEMAMRLSEIEQEYKERSEEIAKNIISLAIQRCASDSVSEATVSVVDLPNDEMKGRIIGREGRNIRTIETLTGVDLIIDDTPEAITVSTAASPHLDGKYAAFGKTVDEESLQVVLDISKVETTYFSGFNDFPVEPVVIKTIKRI